MVRLLISGNFKSSSRIRFHHLWKTLRGWGDEQLGDGDVIWTSPAGQQYVTHPGSALIFPSLCVPTAPFIPDEHVEYDDTFATAQDSDPPSF